MGNVANVKMRPCTVTWNAIDIGYIDGNIEVSMEETLVDITSHQTGSQVLGHIRAGKNVSVTLSMKESDLATLKKMITASGDSVTPSAGTEVFGWGYSKQFLPTYADAKALILHPIHMGAAKTEDVTFWKAYPQLESLTFSGEETQVIPVTFQVYMDETKDEAINIFCIGDSSQDLDAA